MSLRLHDTATREQREFVPVRPGTASIYVCGATVQGAPHIGHVRSGLNYDVLRRWLTHGGLDVLLVRNVTDIEDKVLAKSAAAHRPWWEWAATYERAFQAAYAALGCLPPSIEPRASGHVPQMIELMERLIDSGHAYAAGGDVYFAVRSFPAYGALSGQKIDDVVQGEPDSGCKRDQRDFALWKAAKPGEPSWATPWGRGRPGWHLECSAMAMRFLGETLDIHCGGIDLVFPHHEDEIAQSEAATGQEFSRFWCHGQFLLTDGAKMAKRVGNVATVQDMREQGVSGAAFRHFAFSTHYRKQLNLSPDALEASLEGVRRVGDFADRLASATGGTPELAEAAEELVRDATAALFDDLNAPEAMAALFSFIRRANAELDRDGQDRAALARAREAFGIVNGVLDIVPDAVVEDAELESYVNGRLADRRAARARRDFATADAIRAELTSRGIAIEDGPQGTRWKKLQ